MRIIWRVLSIPASSLSIGATNAAMPCSSRVAVTSSMSMPAAARAASAGAGSSCAVPGTIVPRSATASSVFSGIVLTVSGATSPSTYIVSG